MLLTAKMLLKPESLAATLFSFMPAALLLPL